MYYEWFFSECRQCLKNSPQPNRNVHIGIVTSFSSSARKNSQVFIIVLRSWSSLHISLINLNVIQKLNVSILNLWFQSQTWTFSFYVIYIIISYIIIYYVSLSQRQSLTTQVQKHNPLYWSSLPSPVSKESLHHQQDNVTRFKREILFQNWEASHHSDTTVVWRRCSTLTLHGLD